MVKTSSLSLDSPVIELHGVGSRIAEKLQRLGILQIRDLLFHLPLRYVDRTRLTPIGGLQPGRDALVEGTLELAQVKFGRRRSLLCRISDGTGALTLRFFHFSRSQQNRLQQGSRLRCYGQARRGAHTLEMIHPEYEILAADTSPPVETNLTPVYPATEGLHQVKLRKLARQALALLEHPGEHLNELLPPELLDRLQLPQLTDAIRYVHRPPADAETEDLLLGRHPAQHRLVFEELLAQTVSLQRVRQSLRSHRATPLENNSSLKTRFLNSLPFRLTGAQEKAARSIAEDLCNDSPMLRLLQGDVGSGKTVVAALAGLQTIGAGYQVALMAPTELLAEQHYQTLSNWLSPLDIPVVLLTGKSAGSGRGQSLAYLADSKPCFIVGTHALFQKDVRFGKLRLVIIDEQHRFGVHQRLELHNKGRQGDIFPHQLIMTATPIPRTLAMTIYADLDISVIDELPPGRQPVNTVVISTDRREDVIERIKQACAEGRQVYWVCTLIEESESLQCETAISTHQHLTDRLPEINVGLIHGRKKGREKESIMAAFKSGDIQLLVATTVIEVGVDVPNASLMIIENAERFGLFQLHQLRGRIGRGSIKSDCVLLYQPPLGDNAKTRLDTMRRTDDGFEIAQKDLELRGPGEMMGTRQTGLPDLRIADLMRDAHLLPDIHRAADILMKDYPDHVQPLIDRWLGQEIHYGKV
ncbi:MAG TPA: ATP-dependent DNA helicase RecG [Gammaproteobacteria bacterium]|nr:ATP-dependent DNA helicase RecG [Gammaproteobacteria bacterium]